MLDFTFNGVKASDMGLKIMNIQHSIMPAIRDQYEAIAGRHGSYLFAQAYGDRIVTIECLRLSSDFSNVRQDIFLISAWLNTNDRVRLELSDMPGKYYMAKLTNGGDLNRFLYTGTFTLEFNCEPFAYDDLMLIYSIVISGSPFSRNSAAYNIDYTSVGNNMPRYWPIGTKIQYTDEEQRTIGVIWPLANSLDYISYDGIENVTLYDEAATKSFYMPGTADSYPIISLKGTNTSGQISITLNGTTFSYTGALISGDILTIDCQKYSVKRNDTRAMMYFIGEFPKLVAGENTLSWTLSGGATLTELKITTQGRWY
jgi:predicted phage tail component-like protein